MMCREDEHEMAGKEQQCVTYCASKYCNGITLHSVSLDLEESECPICYHEFKAPVKVVKIKSCKHYFCDHCFEALEKSHGCPMCKKSIQNHLTLSRLIYFQTETWENIMIDHMFCVHEDYHKIKHYLTDLNMVWLRLVNFILETQRSNQYQNVQGIEIVDFGEKEMQEGVRQKQAYAILKMEGEKTQIIFSCLFPSVSFRLIISPNDDSDFGQDNEYADEAVGYMTEQLGVCWRVFPKLLNDEYVDHLLVRKFQNTTCYLLLTGFNGGGVRCYHFTPMKAQLGKLKQCNFDEAHIDGVRNIFPLLKLKNLQLYLSDEEYNCCKFYKEEKKLGEGIGDETKVLGHVFNKHTVEPAYLDLVKLANPVKSTLVKWNCQIPSLSYHFLIGYVDAFMSPET